MRGGAGGPPGDICVVAKVAACCMAQMPAGRGSLLFEEAKFRANPSPRRSSVTESSRLPADMLHVMSKAFASVMFAEGFAAWLAMHETISI